ncbi:fasciclin domain-containing protein [Zunongwangia pacifica]|uniref:Fasciclin domain-containing protein n=1 Tax=Zunongwangia pacifica TaxID=2911062 RepID=A0A9X2CMR6_9FLAO|nr:fasciclin domain-containing protein [Zunongwangia pacifica]MCL6219765.1 fasciclin domain-containing protein [Zunongwangia pacifica]
MKKQQQRNMIDEVKVEDSLLSVRNAQRIKALAESRSIAIIAMEDVTLSNFNRILQNGDLAATLLKGRGPYTVFAPEDEAFGEINYAEFDEYEAASFSKLFILNTSLPYEKLKAGIIENQHPLLLENMEGSTLKFVEKEGEIYIISTSDKLLKVSLPIKASNGFLYKIKGVAKRN